MLLAALLFACNEHPYPREGRAELDIPDTGAPDTGADIPDTDPDPIIVESGEVCYPGAASDWSVCLPLVEYAASWGPGYEYPEPYNGSPQYLAPARYIDLSTADPDLSLAPNFALDELMQEHKGRFGVFQPHVVETLQAIRDAIGGPLSINSAYRNVTYNAGVGGVTYSRHQYGDAVDIGSADATLSELVDHCEAEGASYVSEYVSHVHCDWRDDPLDSDFFDVTEASSVVAAASLPSAVLMRDASGWRAPATGFDEGEPLRRWTAHASDGTILAESVGETFEAPDGTARVSVSVGHQVWLDVQLD